MIEDRCQSGSNCNDLSWLHAFPDYRTLSCLLSCVSTSSLTRAGSVKPDTKNKTIKHGGGGGEVKGALPCFVYIQINAKSQFHKSCTVAKNEIFWWATGQSNLEYKQLTAAKSSKVQFLYSHTYTLANGAVFHSVCRVSLSSGPPEYFIFSDCAWLGNSLIN